MPSPSTAPDYVSHVFKDTVTLALLDQIALAARPIAAVVNRCAPSHSRSSSRQARVPESPAPTFGLRMIGGKRDFGTPGARRSVTHRFALRTDPATVPPRRTSTFTSGGSTTVAIDLNPDGSLPVVYRHRPTKRLTEEILRRVSRISPLTPSSG